MRGTRESGGIRRPHFLCYGNSSGISITQNAPLADFSVCNLRIASHNDMIRNNWSEIPGIENGISVRKV